MEEFILRIQNLMDTPTMQRESNISNYFILLKTKILSSITNKKNSYINLLF